MFHLFWEQLPTSDNPGKLATKWHFFHSKGSIRQLQWHSRINLLLKKCPPPTPRRHHKLVFNAVLKQDQLKEILLGCYLKCHSETCWYQLTEVPAALSTLTTTGAQEFQVLKLGILDTRFFKTGDLILQSKKYIKSTLFVHKKVPTGLGFSCKSWLLLLITGLFLHTQKVRVMLIMPLVI